MHINGKIILVKEKDTFVSECKLKCDRIVETRLAMVKRGTVNSSLLLRNEEN